jgi:hypothetical protein
MLTHEKKMARIERAKQHAATDRLRSGYYSTTADQSLGCSVGCDAIDIAGWQSDFDNPHAIVAEHDGTPEWLERLRDAVFEGLPKEDRAGWHVALAEALPVGVDMQPVYHMLCVSMLELTLEHRSAWADSYGVEVEAAVWQAIAYHCNPTSAARSALLAADVAARSAAWRVALVENAALCAEQSATNAVHSAAWSDSFAPHRAASTAQNAAWIVAHSAASTAQNAAWSVAWSARSAAWSTSYGAADTTESAAWRRIAATTISILSAQAQ